MNITQFLASIWGPVLLAIGIGMFTSRRHYARIYRELENDALATLAFGISAMAAGIAQVTFHNVWNTLPEIIISLIGWGTLLKGLAFVAAPGITDSTAASWAKRNMLPVAATFCGIVGIYLCSVAFFS